MFAVLGYGYGSSGGTFNLPDLRGRTTFGLSGSAPFNALGNNGGTISQIPSLSHTLAVDISNIDVALPNHLHSVPGHSHGFSLATVANNTGSAGAHAHSINDLGHNHTYRSSYRQGSGTRIADSGSTSSHGNDSQEIFNNTTGITINSGGAHTHPIPALAVAGTVGSGASGDAAINSGNPTTNPNISVNPPSTAVTGTTTSSAINITNPYQETNYIIKATNTSAPSIVAVNIPTGTLGQTLHNNGSAWLATSNLFNGGTSVGIGTNTPNMLLSLNAGTGGYNVGIRQNAVGGAHTMELSTGDAAGTAATRLLVRGGNDNADIEFYKGASASEAITMILHGATGNLSIGSSTGYVDSRLSIVGTNGTNDGAITMAKAASQTAFSILPWDNRVFLSAGQYFSNNVRVQHNDDNNNQLFAMDPGSGARWFASNNGTSSFNVASDLQLWDDYGVITGANVNQAPIFSTKTLASRYITPAVGAWYYTGESITITVPAGPSRKYRISMRQMGINSGSANINSGMIMYLSTSISALAGAPTGMGEPYVSVPAGAWSTGFTEGYLNLAPGTHTYYVRIYAISNNIQLANQISDGTTFCAVIAWPY